MENLKNLFVPYELALKLKEKGFNKPCLGYHNIAYGDDSLGFSRGSGHLNSKDKIFPSAPIYQQVVDWFREKHEIELWVSAELGYTKTTYTSHRTGDRISSWHKSAFKTHNEALNDLIEDSLKLIK